MGLWRVIWTGCLGMCCLIPMAWISFQVLDLGAAITNGLVVDIADALDTIFEAAFSQFDVGGGEALIPILIEGSIGVVMLLFFPLHWSLYFRPDEIGFAFAIMLPWMLTGIVTSALFCKSAKKGFDSGMAVGVGYGIAVAVIPYALGGIVSALLEVDITSVITNLADGLFSGMTGLPYAAAVLTSCLEGGLIGGIFGAFIGSLKYDPDDEDSGKKAKKPSQEPMAGSVDYGGAPRTSSTQTISSGATEFCPNCGAKVMPGDPFCPNCGSKI
ncbi:MAG: zinc-ribbon domain-containing protein [Candidatus Lokiarchaeota archaeon]|nr:zinc-ribbon domain-containing protein [Candidatus Lokiarchaeota archaeon]